MRSSLETHLLSCMYLILILFASFSDSSSPSSPFCESQAPFNNSRFYQAGDVVLGGMFQMHYVINYPEVNFTSRPLDPPCTG